MYYEIRRIRKQKGSDGRRFGCAVGKKKIINLEFGHVCSNFLLQFRLFSEETIAVSVTQILEVQRSCGQFKNSGNGREG